MEREGGGPSPSNFGSLLVNLGPPPAGRSFLDRPYACAAWLNIDGQAACAPVSQILAGAQAWTRTWEERATEPLSKPELAAL
jgi:hypothetical protein